MKKVALVIISISLLLSACSPKRQSSFKDSAPPFPVDESKIPDAVPKAEVKSKYGNPKSYVINGHRYHVLASADGYKQKGIASWYGWGFHGRHTSTNERYDSLAMTAASPVLPLPTYAEVTNLDNGKKVVVKINDRGPFVPGSNRIIDLSYAAAKKLGYAGRGTAHVLVAAIDPRKWHFGQKQHDEAPLLAKSDKPAATKLAQTDKPMLATAEKLSLGETLYLQIGAFSKRANAEMLQRKVAKLVQKPVAVKSILSAAQPLYRVQIGPLLTSKESHTIIALLAKHGLTASRVAPTEKAA